MSVFEDVLLDNSVSCHVQLHFITNACLEYQQEMNVKLTSLHHTAANIELGLPKIQDKIEQQKVVIDVLLIIAFLLCFIFATSPHKLNKSDNAEAAVKKVEDVA